MKNQAVQQLSAREFAQNKFNTARTNLLLMLAFTVLNVVLMLVGSDTMLLFAATVPYYMALIGAISEATAVSVFCFAVTVVVLLLYLLCWLFSKKHYAWMIFALALFVIDTVGMIALYVVAEDFSGILDVVIHAWVLYYLWIGVKYGRQLDVLPVESATDAPQANADLWATVNGETADSAVSSEGQSAEPTNDMFAHSAPLRRADEDEKFRVLAECEVFGHVVCYRRVKRVNELVVDGYVYDEFEALVEGAHKLEAKIDGRLICAGFDGAAHSYISVDGETVVRKMRLY